MGAVITSFSGLLFSGGFPWGLSVSLLRVRAAVTTSKHQSQNREIAVCSLLSSPGHTDSVAVGAAKNRQHYRLWAPKPLSQSSLPGLARLCPLCF